MFYVTDALYQFVFPPFCLLWFHTVESPSQYTAFLGSVAVIIIWSLFNKTGMGWEFYIKQVLFGLVLRSELFVDYYLYCTWKLIQFRSRLQECTLKEAKQHLPYNWYSFSTFLSFTIYLNHLLTETLKLLLYELADRFLPVVAVEWCLLNSLSKSI